MEEEVFLGPKLHTPWVGFLHGRLVPAGWRGSEHIRLYKPTQDEGWPQLGVVVPLREYMNIYYI